MDWLGWFAFMGFSVLPYLGAAVGVASGTGLELIDPELLLLGIRGCRHRIITAE